MSKTKIFSLIVVGLFLVIGLSSCGMKEKVGTSPVIEDVFFTDNDAFENYESVKDFPNRNSSMVVKKPYAIVVIMNDPDRDALVFYFSTDSSFPANNRKEIEFVQHYENQFIFFPGWTFDGDPGTNKLYACIEDANGNRSNAYAFDVTYVTEIAQGYGATPKVATGANKQTNER